MPTIAAEALAVARRLALLGLVLLAACAERPPTEVEIGKALGNALSEDGRNPLWELKTVTPHGTSYDKAKQRMIASVDYTIRLKVSRAQLADLLDQSLKAKTPDAPMIDRIETAMAFFDVALGKDWTAGATYSCRGARLEFVSTRDGWTLPAGTRLALCNPA